MEVNRIKLAVNLTYESKLPRDVVVFLFDVSSERRGSQVAENGESTAEVSTARSGSE